MKSETPKRFSSTVLGILIVFSAFTILNFASMSVLAEYHDTDWEITDHQWRENVDITLDRCNLIIKNGGILTFNDSVNLEIICDEAGDQGISIEAGGKFEIDSPSADTLLMSDSDNQNSTYWFTNSGTIDFLGATVGRVYGNPSDKTNTGGIRNEPGSVCNLTNCNIVDADTHSLYIEGNSTNSVELNIENTEITRTSSDAINGTGISIKGNSNVVIDSVSIKYTKEECIKIVNASNVIVRNETLVKGSATNGLYIENSNNVTIQGNTEVRDCGSNGIYLDNSSVTFNDLIIHDNQYDGVVIVNDSAPIIDGSNISGNGRYGIYVEDASPIIRNNPFICYNNIHGIYLNNVWDSNAKIYNNTISNNVGIGIYARDTNISIYDNIIESNGLEYMYSDDFETDTNWTTSGFWHRVDSADFDAPTWNISYNGNWSYWYGQDSTGNYDNGSHNSGNLTSPVFNVTGTSNALLTFMSWSEVNETSGDERWVQIGVGSEWTNLTQISGDPMEQWVMHTVDISSFVPAYNVQIKFCFDTINATDNNHTGWYIDDVAVRYNKLENRTNGIYTNNCSSRINNNTFIQNDYAIYVTESNMTIDNNTFDENEIAIKASVANVTIEYNNIVNHTDKGIYIIDSAESTVFYNDIWNNTGYAIYCEESEVSIYDCNITNNDEGIYLMDDSEGTVYSNIIVKNRDLGDHGGGIDNATGVHIEGSTGTIYNNLMINNKESLFIIDGSASIYNNTIIEEPVPEGYHPIIVRAIGTLEADKVSIYENWIASWTYGGTDGDGMIHIENSINIDIENNTFEGQFEGDITYNFRGTPTNFTDLSVAIGAGQSSAGAIKVINTTANILYNVINGTYSSGIILHYLSSNVINNTITNSTLNGIISRYTSKTTIRNNYVYNSSERGIYLATADSNNTIDHNNISSNQWGIVLNGSSFIDIIDNNIETNDYYGVYLNDTTHNNTIYHNLFINNSEEFKHSTPQAYDNGSATNDWDNGYPSGGNYWSDYDGVDVYGGPGQNLSGCDGIGDTSHGIDTNITTFAKKDGYPIISANMQQYTYWAKSYGNETTEYPMAMDTTSDGGYVVAGYRYRSGGGDDFWVLKLDSDGDVEWEKYYGGSGTDRAHAVQQTDDDGDGEQDDGYIVAGYTQDGDYDYWVIKLYANGTVEWEKEYGSGSTEYCYSIEQTDDDADGYQDDGYILAGATSANGYDAWIIKVNAMGNKTWDYTYGDTSDDRAKSVCQASNGNYTVAGWTTIPGSGRGRDYWVFQINETGDMAWQKYYGSDDDEQVACIQTTSDDGYILTGRTSSFGSGSGIGKYDMWTLKLDNDGDVVWDNLYGINNSAENGRCIRETSDGGFIVSGYTQDSGYYESWVLKLDSNGSVEWQKRYGGNYYDMSSWSVQESSDGGYAVTGYTTSFGGGGYDYWVYKVGPTGGITFDYGSGAHVNDTAVTPWSVNYSTDSTSITKGNLTDTETETDRGSTDTYCNVETQATPSYGWY